MKFESLKCLDRLYVGNQQMRFKALQYDDQVA